MALPFILAGPIVRRVAPRSVSVWIALSKRATVTLKLWDKPVTSSSAGGALFNTGDVPIPSQGATQTLRVGAALHLALVTIELVEGHSPALLPGKLYSYNLGFTGAFPETDLHALGLLHDRAPSAALPAWQVALGYQPGRLPSFVLPPVTINKLNLVHGSCRKAHGPGKDSLAALDVFIKKAVIDGDPDKRPHQLFLTGDQIYADEVPTILLRGIFNLGTELLGVKENLSAKKSDNTIGSYEATLLNFPGTRRERVCTRNARFTSTASQNHLLSFGEFAATYIMYWNPDTWPAELFGEYEGLNDKYALGKYLLSYMEDFQATWNVDPLTDIERDLAPLDEEEQKKLAAESAGDKAKRVQKIKEKVKSDLETEMPDVFTFRDQLPYARRALANVPVYMIMDDHEITDDWYITKDWKDRVLTSQLGVNLLRNGLMAYTLFQDWGNDPESYKSGAKQDLLNHLQLVMPETGEGPVKGHADIIDQHFGFNLMDETPPPVQWHYKVPCGETTVYVLDTRTRRTYESRLGPPGLLSNGAMDDQVPLDAQPEAFLIFVSPAPVLGVAAFEELLQPAMTAFNDFNADPEAWGFHAATFENFLARMKSFKKVIFLSGDVHFGFATYMDYWNQNEAQASARFVQFVSSGLKNQKFPAEQFLIAGFVQKLLGSLFYPGRRLGWKLKLGLEVNNPAGLRNPPKHRLRLRREPVLLPVTGWPKNSTANRGPDWRWRLKLQPDTRPDDSSPGSRPEKVRVKELDVALTADGYEQVAARHQLIFKNSVARTIVWDSNIGIIRFLRNDAGEVKATQDLLYWRPGDDVRTDDPAPYTSFSVDLTPTADPADRPDFSVEP